jgi:PAS domain S-box-containing protein
VDGSERDVLAEIGGDTAQAVHVANTHRTLRRHETAVEAVPEGVFILDEDAVIRLANDEAAALLGRTPDSLRDEPFPTLVEEGVFSESIVDWYLEAVREMLSSESDRREAHHETEIRPTSGESRRVEIHLTVRPFDEEFSGTVGVIRDVTERRSRERSLEHQQSVLNSVVETVPQGILVVDDDRNFVTYNEQFVDMWGIPDDVVESGDDERALESVLDDLERPDAFLETVEYMYDHPTEVSRDLVHLADGRIFQRYRGPVTGESGTYFGRVAVFQDITDRERSKRELKRYETLVEEAASGVFAQDAEGRYSYVNTRIEERTGYDREEILGRTPEMFMPPEDIERIDDGIREMLEGTRERLEFESTITTAADEEVPIEGQLAPLTSDEGVEGTVGVVRDVTERKERERTLERQNERLERFARMVSHDLRNPLNVASGRLDLVREEVDNDDLDEVAQAHRRMEALIDDLLRLTREGKAVAETNPVALSRTAGAAWRNVAAPEATLETTTEVTVLADPSRLQQLLENLFRNAREHAGEDATVELGALDDRAGFYVADDGPGIPEGERERVFQSGVSTTEEGTGVGLAIVREVARGHDWEVSVTRSDAGGARFEFAGVDVDP